MNRLIFQYATFDPPRYSALISSGGWNYDSIVISNGTIFSFHHMSKDDISKTLRKSTGKGTHKRSATDTKLANKDVAAQGRQGSHGDGVNTQMMDYTHAFFPNLQE